MLGGWAHGRLTELFRQSYADCFGNIVGLPSQSCGWSEAIPIDSDRLDVAKAGEVGRGPDPWFGTIAAHLFPSVIRDATLTKPIPNVWRSSSVVWSLPLPWIAGIFLMLLRLLAAFILIPLIELYLLLQLAEVTSVPLTIGIVIGTGVLGSLLARREGTIAWYRFRSALGEGRVPSREIQDGLMIVFAAALLLTPGLLTDIVGFMMLLPIGRNLIRRLFLRRIAGRTNIQVTTFSTYDVEEPMHRTLREDRNTIDAVAVRHKGS